MRKINLMAVFFFCALLILFVYAEESEVKTSPTLVPGVETIKIGGLNIIVPKGARVRKRAAEIVIEDLGGYAGRKITRLEKRISLLEKSLHNLQQEVKQLQETVNALNSMKVITR